MLLAWGGSSRRVRMGVDVRGASPFFLLLIQNKVVSFTAGLALLTSARAANPQVSLIFVILSSRRCTEFNEYFECLFGAQLGFATGRGLSSLFKFRPA